MSAAEARDSVLEVDGLGVSYERRAALDDISLKVPRGSVFVLLGRNGAGKSSLVRCVLGFQKPDAGRVRLFGTDVWTQRARLMTRIGVMPEEPDAPPDMTARELQAFCRRLYPTWDQAGVESRLARFETPLDVPFGRLSKGQKGAVMLSLCLGHTPDLLVLDDPTLGLDAVARRALYDELIGDLADRGATVFLTTHDLAGIEGLATHVAILKGARLAVNEEVETLKARFRRIRGHAPAANGVGAWHPFVPVAERRHEWGQEAIVSNFDEASLAAFARRGAEHVEVGTLSLEEIFVGLVEAGGQR